MKLKSLNDRSDLQGRKLLTKRFAQYQKLMAELNQLEFQESIIGFINQKTDFLNAVSINDNRFGKYLRSALVQIIDTLEKELQLVPKNHYQNKYLALGLVFGVPFGFIFATILDQMAFIGIGLPIGMSIGIAIGASMDKKAAREGRQLEVEAFY